jgi:hypothetical protein
MWVQQLGFCYSGVFDFVAFHLDSLRPWQEGHQGG